MSEGKYCDQHAWASVGTVARDETVGRIWKCENCPVWTTERFDPDDEREWDDTWLSDR